MISNNLMKKYIYLVALLLVGCSNTKKINKESTTRNPLEGTWVLKNILMGDAMDVSCGFVNEGKVREMTITFSSDKVDSKFKLYGNSSVNDFSGTYSLLNYNDTIHSGKLLIHPLSATKMASINSSWMACENRYLSNLEKMEEFKVSNNRLQLIHSFKIIKYSDSASVEFYQTILYFDKK